MTKGAPLGAPFRFMDLIASVSEAIQPFVIPGRAFASPESIVPQFLFGEMDSCI
jgi:hypothetical protein